MSGNPFAISAILPGLVIATLAVEVAVLLGIDATLIAGTYMVLTAGLLLIPAVNQRGSLTLTHDGISFEQGKRRLTAPWEHVAGVMSKADCGLCIEVIHPEVDGKPFRSPGGLRADQASTAQIPLRFFGDRQYSILYDLRERVPAERWKDALTKASKRGRVNIAVVYALTVAICCGAMFAVMYAITH